MNTLKLRLRAKLLLSLLLVSSSLTCATLWIVGRSIHAQLLTQIDEDLGDSVRVLRDFQRQREINLTQSAELLANLPSLKALMTTHDAATIQDASADFWKLAPSDFFILADPTGQVEAIHTNRPGVTRDLAQDLLASSLGDQQSSYWWYGGGKLYQVFLQPIYFGGANSGSIRGILGIGHEISDALSRELSHLVSSDIAFFYGEKLIVSTLDSLTPTMPGLSVTPKEVRVGNETFLSRTVQLSPAVAPFVHLAVFKSYDKAAIFLNRLNRLLIALGLVSILAGSALVFLISHTFTKPLASLVAAVRALGKGDFVYPVTSSGSDEIAEVTDAFDRMRHDVRRMQQDLLRAERLATIGQMAAFVSHDLRHPLTAVLANAEFLCEADLTRSQRDELYWEVCAGVERMTNLIDSLLEFSHSRDSLQTDCHLVKETVQRAIHLVKSRPEFQQIAISVSGEEHCEAAFDRRKIERVLVNVLVNACEFVSSESGLVDVSISALAGTIEIRIEDNGPGIPDEIREKLFQPFVSSGKPNGIGLGLTIAKKILQDHRGDICLQTTRPGKTIFRLTLPKEVNSESLESLAMALEDDGRSINFHDERLAGDRTGDGRRIVPTPSSGA